MALGSHRKRGRDVEFSHFFVHYTVAYPTVMVGVLYPFFHIIQNNVWRMQSVSGGGEAYGIDPGDKETSRRLTGSPLQPSSTAIQLFDNLFCLIVFHFYLSAVLGVGFFFSVVHPISLYPLPHRPLSLNPLSETAFNMPHRTLRVCYKVKNCSQWKGFNSHISLTSIIRNVLSLFQIYLRSNSKKRGGSLIFFHHEISHISIHFAGWPLARYELFDCVTLGIGQFLGKKCKI